MSKPQPPPDDQRCTYTTADNRRCRHFQSGDGITLCPQHVRVEARHARQLARAEARRLSAVVSFANALPPAAEQFVAQAQDHAMPGTVISINQMIERALFMLVSNQMSHRTATAAAQLLRLLLKAQPQVDAETTAINRAMYQQYLETGTFPPFPGHSTAESAPEHAVEPDTAAPPTATAPLAPVTRASSPCPNDDSLDPETITAQPNTTPPTAVTQPSTEPVTRASSPCPESEAPPSLRASDPTSTLTTPPPSNIPINPEAPASQPFAPNIPNHPTRTRQAQATRQARASTPEAGIAAD